MSALKLLDDNHDEFSQIDQQPLPKQRKARRMWRDIEMLKVRQRLQRELDDYCGESMDAEINRVFG